MACHNQPKAAISEQRRQAVGAPGPLIAGCGRQFRQVQLTLQGWQQDVSFG